MRRFRTEHDDWIKPGELRSLLERLHAEDADPEPEDDHTTVAAVCEATGESESRIWQMLDQIRSEDLQSRLSERLKEAEEPLYRVERPGASHDPLGSKTWQGRQRAFNSILDSLPRPSLKKHARKAQKAADDVASRFAGYLILALVLALVIFILYRAIEKGLL